jgi:N-acetylmuramoyl-L-alanine amidase
MNIIDRPSPNHSPRKPGVRVDTIVIHHTGDKHHDASIRWLCVPSSGVSAHYVVGTKGEVFRLVDEGRKAWHAGIAHLPWETGPWPRVVTKGGKRVTVMTDEGYDFNHRSIGIEVVNPGDGKTPFTEAQYAALCWLVPDIARRLGWQTALLRTRPVRVTCSAAIGSVGHVMGHRDVAPGRKTDPADNFDWGRIRDALAGRTT